jgi:hypothetical protein
MGPNFHRIIPFVPWSVVHFSYHLFFNKSISLTHRRLIQRPAPNLIRKRDDTTQKENRRRTGFVQSSEENWVDQAQGGRVDEIGRRYYSTTVPGSLSLSLTHSLCCLAVCLDVTMGNSETRRAAGKPAKSN